MIKVENITKKYGNYTAVDNMSFKIEEGEIVGFLGPNGAGKTTTMSMITGFIEPTSGHVEINGYNVSKKAKKAKREIGYMPETTPLYNELTPKEFVGYMSELKGVSKKEKKAEIERVLKAVGIEEVQNKLIRNLSRGFKQRVSLAGALVGNPKVLILDEPTVGLDPKQVTQIRSLIKSLGKDHTVILSSHILSEVSQICQKVIIINKGKVVAIDTPENLENKTNSGNVLIVTVEDPENKIEETVKEMQNIQELKLLKNLPDGTKQYSISSKGEKDMRKDVFSLFAKNGITIFELKKAETTLEEAFINLIDNQKNEKPKTKEEIKKEKRERKEKSKQEKLKKKEGGDK
ncbi:MAG: ABC transporter ATP-binding protein [Clostridia bacterium]|nr:ABC transporter ATP-binding protein [Clostridia bacterium]